MIVPIYLFLYNTLQTGGWGFILFTLITQVVEKQSLQVGLWPLIAQPLQLFQYAAALEVLHCILGFVPSPLFTTFSQVLSRVALVFVSSSFSTARDSLFFTTMIFAWSLTEVIRYSYYALYKSPLSNSFLVKALTYLRYTLFYVLYPIGVASELTLVYKAVEHILINHLPVTFPVAFLNSDPHYTTYFAYFLICNSLLYVPGFPMLYMYMINQRSKVLGGASLSSKKDTPRPNNRRSPASPKPRPKAE